MQIVMVGRVKVVKARVGYNVHYLLNEDLVSYVCDDKTGEYYMARHGVNKKTIKKAIAMCKGK